MRLRVSSGGTTEDALEAVDRLRSVARGHRSEEQEEKEDDSANDDALALSRVIGTVLGPRAVGLAGVVLDLVTTELVVDQTHQGNRVTEELETGDGSVPEHHRGGDQEDILEDTAQGHDQGRSLANL